MEMTAAEKVEFISYEGIVVAVCDVILMKKICCFGLGLYV
jgi:hypothetical protein